MEVAQAGKADVLPQKQDGPRLSCQGMVVAPGWVKSQAWKSWLGGLLLRESGSSWTELSQVSPEAPS